MSSWRTAVRVAFAGLRHSPLRTLLSTLGVVVGVAALVAVLAVGDGVERYARDQIAQTTDLQAVLATPITTHLVDHQMVPQEGYPVFRLADASELASRLPAGTVLSLGTQGSAILTTDSGTSRGVLVRATDSAAAVMTKLQLIEGRYFSQAETASGAKVVVVSERLKEAVAASVGGFVSLGNDTLEVIGVARTAPSDEFLRAWVPLPLATGVMVRDGQPRAPILAVLAPTVEDAPRVRAEMETWLHDRYGDIHDRVRVASNDSRLRQARQALLVFKILMGSITGVALLVGGIGIMNVLLASVAERTREIGIRRATGARRRDIAAQFLAEALAVTGTGALLGVLAGWGGAWITTAIMRAKTQAIVHAAATLPTFGVAVLAGVTVGLVFGLYPALKAARLPPIEAIRHE